MRGGAAATSAMPSSSPGDNASRPNASRPNSIISGMPKVIQTRAKARGAGLAQHAPHAAEIGPGEGQRDEEEDADRQDGPHGRGQAGQGEPEEDRGGEALGAVAAEDGQEPARPGEGGCHVRRRRSSVRRDRGAAFTEPARGWVPGSAAPPRGKDSWPNRGWAHSCFCEILDGVHGAGC